MSFFATQKIKRTEKEIRYSIPLNSIMYELKLRSSVQNRDGVGDKLFEVEFSALPESNTVSKTIRLRSRDGECQP